MSTRFWVLAGGKKIHAYNNIIQIPIVPNKFSFVLKLHIVNFPEGLYFAACWCPDCVASKPFVSAAFNSQKDGEKLFDLVYISSDNDSAQMKGEIEGGWDAVAFEKMGERSKLKKHFGVCAQKEMEELDISGEQRKGGIPTLILLEKKSCQVLRADAIPDLMGDKKIDNPLDLWKSLLSENSP